MRLIILIGAMLAVDFYSYQAVTIISQHWFSVAQSIVFWGFWSFPVLSILFLLYSNYSRTAGITMGVYTSLRTIIILGYLSKTLIGLVLLIDDSRRFIIDLFDLYESTSKELANRSYWLSFFGVLFGGTTFGVFSYGMIRNRHRYKTFKETIYIDALPQSLAGLKIVQISDIHSGSFTSKKPLDRAVELINQEQADLVFFTGDLVNSVASEMEPYLDVFDKIKAKHGIYSVLGNHDYGDYVRWSTLFQKEQNLKELINHHKTMGWDILLNENRILTINNQKIGIIGVENYSGSKYFQKYGDLGKAYLGVENTSLKLLLSHDPTHWDAQIIDSFKDIDITFSGHTHGMQFGIEIPGFLKWSPAKLIYKQWAGLYKNGNQFLYVNRGFGYLGYPGRVGILPEITVITLESVDKDQKLMESA